VSIEKDDVKKFALDSLVLSPNEWTWTKELLDAYAAWREKRGMTPTQLNVDSFGKFMPKLGEPVVKMRDGVQLRGISGVKVAG